VTLTDSLAAALAAHHHLRALWSRRHEPRVRTWLRGYLMAIRICQDEIEHLAAVMQRERQEYLAAQDEDTQLLTSIGS
jgi:hypothetical protein